MKKIIFIIVMICVGWIIWFSTTTNKQSEIKEQTSKSIVLKLGHNLPKNSAMHQASIKYAQLIEQRTHGDIKIEVYPNQELGNDHQMIEMAKKGEIDILLTPTAKLSVQVPSMQFVDLPFLFPSRQDAYRVLDGEAGKALLHKLDEIDLVGVSFWENGFKHFTSNFPLIAPEDFQNKKIRVMKSRIIMEQFKALGAEPVAIDFHSTKKALEDGVVDGQENPLIAIVSMDFHKVQKYLTLSEHAYLAYVFSISKKTLEKLPSQTIDLMISTAKEITSWEREETQKSEAKLLEIVKKEGVIVSTLSQEQKEKFRVQTKYIVDRFEKVIGSDIISKTHNLLCDTYPSHDTVVLGLDCDLSGVNKNAGFNLKIALSLATQKINESGGILGKKIVLMAKDNKGIASVSSKNLDELYDMDNLIGIVGGKLSAVINSQIEKIRSKKIPYFIPWAASPSLTDMTKGNDNLFRVSLNDSFAVKFLIKELLQNYSNSVFVVENSLWGDEAKGIIEGEYTKANLQKPTIFQINRGKKSFSELNSYMVTQKVDSLCMILNPSEASKLKEDMSKNNLTIPVISHWGVLGSNFFEKNKEYLQKIDLQFINTFLFTQKDQAILESIEKIYDLTAYEISAPNAIAQAYDSVNLLIEGIKKAQSFEPELVIKALESLESYQGVIKNYTHPFSSKDHDALDISDLFMSRYNDQGFIEKVK